MSLIEFCDLFSFSFSDCSQERSGVDAKGLVKVGECRNCILKIEGVNEIGIVDNDPYKSQSNVSPHSTIPIVMVSLAIQ